MPRRWLVLGCGLTILALAGGGYRLVEIKALRAELEKARVDFESGYRGLARQRLEKLARQWSTNAEVLFQLGVCEEATGHRETALATWAKIPSGTPFSTRAAVLRGEILIDSGKYSAAESILETALRAQDQGSDISELRRSLIRLYRFEGRTADVRKLVRESWPTAADPVAVLKELWTMDNSPVPAEALATVLAKADPIDDRVWLGQANLATLRGRLEEAKRKLEACRTRRPSDDAIWRGQLEFARAANDVNAAREVLPYLSISKFSEAEVLSLRAWLASRLNRPDDERHALRSLLERNPSDVTANERLAALAWEDGQKEEATRLRTQKKKVDDARARYRALVLDSNDQAANAPELARLATSLGLRFEAQAWSHLDAEVPVKSRLVTEVESQESAASTTIAGTLSDRLANLFPSSAWTSSTSFLHTTANPSFKDDAQASGLEFTFDNGQTPLHQLPETMSGGVAIFDYDGDGWFDVYVVQGGSLNPSVGEKKDGGHLFRNQGNGTFRDVTVKSELANMPHEYGISVTVGDYNNDGHPDLFVTRLRSYALYRNRGNGTFADATEAAGLLGVRDLPSSAAFADLDNDGDLDLYVCQYMLYDPDHPRLCPTEEGEYLYCTPSRVDPAPDHVFRNDRGRFVDVTTEAGFVDPGGRGLGVVVADLDDDNKVDLFVANDGTANYLFRNLGGFRFEENGHIAGVAGNAAGGYHAGMGVACVDLDGDGRPELLVTNFYGEGTTLYQNLGQGIFHDQSAASGLGVSTRYLLGFGIAPLDFDADGRPDLMMANGHVNDQRPKFPYAMPARLFAGGAGGRLTDVSDRAGAPFQTLRVGRGLATGDLDNDGKVDALLLAQNEPLSYFHNQSHSGHFVTFLLQGTRSNRDGVGARVTVTSRQHRQVAQRVGGGSYQSASDPRLHFGLGRDDIVESVEVRWPSGHTDRYTNLASDTGYRLREGDPSPQPLPGFQH